MAKGSNAPAVVMSKENSNGDMRTHQDNAIKHQESTIYRHEAPSPLVAHELPAAIEPFELPQAQTGKQ